MPHRNRFHATAAPLLGRQALLRWLHLILGGALAMPFYLPVLVAVDAWLNGSRNGVLLIGAQLAAFLAALGLAAGAAALIPAVRVVEGGAARALLGGRFATMPTGRAVASGARGRSVAWFTLHLGLGGLVAGASLALPPLAVVLLVAPLLGHATTDRWTRDVPVWWGPPLALALLLALVLAAAGAGRLLARCAPRLLGPSPAEALADRLAASEQRAERLAHRNRIARELHDSVGHALSVVTLQAGAAGRMLATDPDFARRALAAIEESARTATAELDQVLGLLREETDPAGRDGERAPLPDLGRLDQLLAAARAAGTEVHARVVGDPATLPVPVSRAAYRIVQEGLTNALRHGGRVPVRLTLGVDAEALEVEMTNPVSRQAHAPQAPAPQRPGEGRGGSGGRGGRGLIGLEERVAALGGIVAAARAGDEWRLRARLPLGGRP